MKLRCYNLVFEVTRKCNMQCKHCMRGDAQCKDISHEVIDAALDGVDSIGTITFTGGEISMNIEAIFYILESCKKRNINVDNFYAVTNGKVVETEFLLAMCMWHCYSLECGGDPEYNGLALSHDMFHDDIPVINLHKLQALSFFRREDKEVDWNRVSLINLGRARSLAGFTKKDKYYSSISAWYDEDSDIVESEETMTITVDGDVLSDCDYEYESTDIIKVCNVFDSNWVEAVLHAEEVMI